MKLKLFSFFAIACLCVFVIQSCTSEINGDDEIETSSIEYEIGDGVAVAAVKYCRYNVTKSSVPGIEEGDIVCVPCDEPCAKNLTNHEVSYPVNNKGLVSGTRVGKRCKKCPTGGSKV